MKSLFWLIGICFAAFELHDKTMNKPNIKGYWLPPIDEYIDWWKVTDENIEKRVLGHVDCWIVALCPLNQLPQAWKKYVGPFRGAIFFGRFWDSDGENLKERFGYEGKPMLLVYKWTRKAKEIKPEITDDLAVALEMVVESMPVKNLNQISFNVPEEAEASMDQFLLRAFYGEEKKPKFPIVFVYNEDDTKGVPPVIRIIAHYFSDYFLFGLVTSDQVATMRKTFPLYPIPKASELPQAIAFIGMEPDEKDMEQDESLSFQLVVNSKVKFGEFNFNNLVGYLFWINDQFREILPGYTEINMDDETLKTIIDKLWWRLKVIKPAQMKDKKKLSALDKKAKDSLTQFEKLKKEADKIGAANLEAAKKIAKKFPAEGNDKKDEL